MINRSRRYMKGKLRQDVKRVAFFFILHSSCDDATMRRCTAAQLTATIDIQVHVKRNSGTLFTTAC